MTAFFLKNAESFFVCVIFEFGVNFNLFEYLFLTINGNNFNLANNTFNDIISLK